ncbi:DMT family transporter [Streptomyces gobitricini]|uniref:EamA domain-containing protein n=1 Tax=Streptomyces gobitricini TaxID=68211 RepID=A0ABP5YS98_9ACTN
MDSSNEQVKHSEPSLGRHTGPLLVLAAALMWSTTGIAGQLLPDVSPATIATLRLTLGAAVLCLTLLFASQRGGAGWRSLNRQQKGIICLAGVCTAAFQIFFFFSVRMTGAALGTLTVLTSAPLCAAVIDWLSRGERPSSRWYVGTALAVTGVFLLTFDGGDSLRMGGVALAVLCGACYAGYSATTGALVKTGVPRTFVVRTSLTIGGVMLAPILLGADYGSLGDTRSVAIVAWLAVVGTALPYLAFVAGLQYTAARTAASVGLAQPLAAAVLALVVLHEPFTAPMIAATALLVVGLLVVSLPGRDKAAAGGTAPPASEIVTAPVGDRGNAAVTTAQGER